MAEINWGALQTPDYTGNALRAQELGQDARKRRVTENALQRYSTDPEGAVADLMAVDPQAALLLQKTQRENKAYQTRQAVGAQVASGDMTGATKTAAAAGDFDTMGEIAKLTKEQRDVAKQNAQDHGAYALSLKGLPYEQRKAKIMADASELVKSGFTQEQLAAFDPTDANLDAQAASAMDLKMAIDKADKDRNFGLAQDKFGEEKRHNRVGEDVSREQVGISRGQLGVAQAGLGIRQAELGLSKDRLAFDQAGGKVKPLPPQIAAGHATNEASMKQIDKAIAALDKHPNAIGLIRQGGEGINQRMDPDGIEARALLADIGSLKLHERSGAAVSASESPRLLPFIPRVTDTHRAAKEKLMQLRQQLENNNAEMEVQYGADSGYRPLTSAPAAAPAKRPPLSAFQK